jgi:exosortase A
MKAVSLTLDATATPSPWRAVAVIVCASLIVVLCIFLETTASMVAAWHSSTFTHGYFILPVCAYLVWSRRKRLAGRLPTFNLWGLPLLGVLAFGWLLGALADVLVVQEVALVGMLEVLVWMLLGPRVTLALVLPLGILWFAVPIGEVLVLPLQDVTALFTMHALQLSGIPTLLEGRRLFLPSGTWDVAEACSGIRYLLSSLMVGCLYASWAYRSWARRLGFLLACVVVPIFANCVRVYGIILLGYLSNQKLAVGVDHLIWGWIFFGMVTMLLLWLGSFWQEPTVDSDAPGSSDLISSAVMEADAHCTYSAWATALAAAGGVALVALAPVSARVLLNRVQTPVVVRATAPQVSPPWVELTEYADKWVPHFVGTDAEVVETYTAGAQPVHLYVGYYANERQGAELINSENAIMDRKQWLTVTERRRLVAVDDRSVRVDETIMRSSGRTRLAWTWYWIAGEFTSNPYYGKYLLAKARLFGMHQGTAVVAVSADCEFDCTTATHTLQDFLHHNASLQATLRGFSERDKMRD